MSPHPMQKYSGVLKRLRRAPRREVKEMIGKAPPALIKALCECCINVLKGRVRLTAAQKKRLHPHKRALRELSKKKTRVKDRKRMLQKGGFLPALLGPLVGLVGSLFK